MRKDLERTWDKEGVPNFHREAYLKHINSLSSHSAAVVLTKELADLLQRKSPIQETMAAVRKREDLLKQLQDLETEIDDVGLLQLDLQDVLQQLQKASIEVVNGVVKWRETAGSQAPFIWKNQNYVLKMKTDLKAFAQSPLAKFLPFIADDPMLIRTLNRSEIKLASSRASKQRSRAQAAELVLVEEPEPSPLLDTGRFDAVAIDPARDDKDADFVPESVHDKSVSISSSFPKKTSQDTIDLAKWLTNELITAAVDADAPQFCLEACEEYQAAHMVLYTSKILDDVISLALKDLIPICTQEAYTEEIDREFITLQKQILETVLLREVIEGVESWSLEVIAEELTKEFAAMVEVDDIVDESIAEETKLNQQMIAAIFQQLVDSYMSEEWLEITCEDVLSDEILNQRLDELPIAILKRVLKENPQKHIEKQAEMSYCNMLFQYVGDIWLRRVVQEVMYEEGGSLVNRQFDTFAFYQEPVRRHMRHTSRF